MYVVHKLTTPFFLNNQPDAPIVQIYSVIKLYMLGCGHQKPA
jgi:hypothetical protein